MASKKADANHTKPKTKLSTESRKADNDVVYVALLEENAKLKEAKAKLEETIASIEDVRIIAVMHE